MAFFYLTIILSLLGFTSCRNKDSEPIKPELVFDTSFPIKKRADVYVKNLNRGNIKLSYNILAEFDLNEKEENLLETIGKHSKKKQNKYHSFFISIDENRNDTLDVNSLLKSLNKIDSINRKPPCLYSYAFTKNKYKGFVKENIKIDSTEQSFYYLAELSLYIANKRIRVTTNVIDDFSNLYKINESRSLLNSLEVTVKSDSL